MNELKVFDAFSGIGGFRKGVELSSTEARKFKFVAASDSDALCKNVYNRLYDTSREIFFDDVGLLHTSKNQTGEPAPDFDLLLAGFPCQRFANIGHRKGFDDDRGTLIFQICDLLDYYQPRFFILENVQKMRNLGKGRTLETIKDLLKAVGYSICVWDLCASNYGVPQQRRRLIFCGVKDNKPQDINLPSPIEIDQENRRYKTTWHLLEKDMPSEHIVPPKTSETVFRRNSKWQGDLDINRLLARPLTATMAKWHRANQDNYFSEDFVFAKNLKAAASCSPVPNGKAVRRISLLEGIRLQGFEDDVFEVFKDLEIRPTAGFRLIGNSIPVPLVTAVTKSFLDSV